MFVMLVMTELPPDISLLLLCGVFVTQLVLDAVYTEKICCKLTCSVPRNEMRGYRNLDGDDDSIFKSSGDYSNDPNQEQNETTISGVHLGKMRKFLRFLKFILENKIVKIFAVLLQLSSVVVFIVLWYTVFFPSVTSDYNFYKLLPIIAFPICLLILSVIWTNKYQIWIAKAQNTPITSETKAEARYKSSESCMHE